MRVAIDLRTLHEAVLNSPGGGLGGPGMYSYELTRHLLAAARGADVEWTFLTYPARVPAMIKDLARDAGWDARAGHRARGRVLPVGVPYFTRRLMHSRYSQWAALVEGAWLSAVCRAVQPDVYQSLDMYAVPWASGATKSVSTVHDLYDLLVRGRSQTTWQRRLIGARARRFHALAPVSQDTADDVHTLLGVPADRIHVVYPGVNPALLDHDTNCGNRGENSTLAGVPEPFFLHVGVLRPRKNPDNLLAGVARVIRERLPEHFLVCVGPYQTTPGLRQALQAKWQAAGGSADRLVILGSVTDEELVTLYRQTTGLVFPSLHEGFGQTVAEAFAVGTPAVTSRAGASPESGGDLAIYVDPLDPASIAEGCYRMARDEDHRARVRREGPAWIAERFTWPQASQSLLHLYARLVSESR